MSKQTLKYKIRQFQWFQMETRVRQMVHQLIMPFQRRIMQNSTLLNGLKSFTNQQSVKLQQLRLLITNDPKNKSINAFKQIDKRFQDQSKNIMELKNLVGQQTKMIQKRFIMQDERLKQNNEIVLNNMQLKQRVNQQIRQQNDNITQFRNNLQSMIQQLSGQLTKNHKQQQQNFKKSIERDNSLEERIRQLQKHKRFADQKFHYIDNKHNQFQKSIIHLNQQVKSLNKQIQNLNQNLIYTKKLANYVQQLQQKIKQLDFSIQTLSPLITQAQISDTLYIILPPKLKKRLIIQQNQKYSKLNADVLENDYKNVKQKFNGMQMLEAVQKRNYRQIIEMKRRKLLAQGIDIDNVTYQQRQKYYREVTFSDEFEEQGVQNVQIKAGVQQGQIIKLIQNQLDNYKIDLTKRLRSQIQDSKKYILEMQEEIQRLVEDNSKKIDIYNNKFQLFQTDLLLQTKHLNELILEKQKQASQIQQQIKKINQNLFSFIQFCSLVNHLQIQDQLDKQSISLFGIKETFHQTLQGKRVLQTQKKKIIDFNSQCFSCCGYPASTIAAFKMACLTYNPSHIIIQSKEYKRQEILEISTKILQYIKNKIMVYSHADNLLPDELNEPKISNFGQDEILQNKNTGTFELIQKQANKWRRTKRINTSGHTKIIHQTTMKSASKRKEDLGNISYVFSQNKRRNMGFLN